MTIPVQNILISLNHETSTPRQPFIEFFCGNGNKSGRIGEIQTLRYFEVRRTDPKLRRGLAPLVFFESVFGHFENFCLL